MLNNLLLEMYVFDVKKVEYEYDRRYGVEFLPLYIHVTQFSASVADGYVGRDQ